MRASSIPGFCTYDEVGARLELRQHRRPHPGLPVIHDHQLHEPGVQHVEHILVLEGIRNRYKLGRRLPVGRELRVQARQALVVAGRGAHVHGFARQILEPPHGSTSILEGKLRSRAIQTAALKDGVCHLRLKHPVRDARSHSQNPQ